VNGRGHFSSITTYGENTTGTSEVLEFWVGTSPPDDRWR
jgi:hypothetical protein